MNTLHLKATLHLKNAYFVFVESFALVEYIFEYMKTSILAKFVSEFFFN